MMDESIKARPGNLARNFYPSHKGKIRKSWTPLIDPAVNWNGKLTDSEFNRFERIIEEKYNVRFDSYWEFHQWSVKYYAEFWGEIWNYFGIISSKPYHQVLVKTGHGFLDNTWFTGAKFNFAENILRIRDERIALICIDEQGNEETVTFAAMFEEVRMYAAAFRKNGLNKYDTVACFMSNRKEAIFAMLATISVGAIWGGPLPYYGGKAASNVVKTLNPKFLITVDTFQMHGDKTSLLEKLPVIVDRVPSIVKVILVVTEGATYHKDLSKIRNCVFLEHFLQDALDSDLIFEQLPSGHPITVNFTSGTSGIPKGPIHSAESLLPHLRDFGLHLNMKCGDVVFSLYPVGWSMWDYFIPFLALGVKILLFCGSPYFKDLNLWDLFGKYGVKYAILSTSVVDSIERQQLVPSPGTNLDSLEIIAITGSPAKEENFTFLHTKVKEDLFIGSLYGATEIAAYISTFNLNMPVYGREIQVLSLGMDIQCFNSAGKSVIGEMGDLVLCTPAPGFPVGLWKDVNNIKINATYLTKYPGVWSQHDICWVNPNTKGIVIIGRSDHTLNQNGDIFGAADIYSAIHSLKELHDYVCVGQKHSNGDSRAVLFVKMKSDHHLTPDMKEKIQRTIHHETLDDCVPQVILQVPDIPYNLNNKRMESVIWKIVETNEIPDVVNIKNPESLKHFLNIPELVSYDQVQILPPLE